MHNILRILFLSFLMMLFACGGEESASLDPQVIRVVDDEFSPKVLRVEPGTTVIWESGGNIYKEVLKASLRPPDGKPTKIEHPENKGVIIYAVDWTMITTIDKHTHGRAPGLRKQHADVK